MTGQQDEMACPECHSTNVLIVNPLSLSSDLWECQACHCLFREHYLNGEIEVVRKGTTVREKPVAKIIRSPTPDWTWCALCYDDRRRPYVGNCPEDCARRSQILGLRKEGDPYAI